MSSTHLREARNLQLPSRDETLRRDRVVSKFWQEHASLLREAWKEWEEEESNLLPTLDENLFDPRLREAVTAAWEDPTKENLVRDLWEPVAPGVLKCQFFDPKRLAQLRTYLTAAAKARIPVRPPYGIVLNRDGAMLDPRSIGYLAGPSFQAFYRQVFDRYFRPISRLLFPEVFGFDSQSFGFSIVYEPGNDTSIRPHTDASSATLNINLNLPGEEFQGSVVDFFDPNTGNRKPFIFEPGVAAIHRGRAAHAARPITQGSRTNLVLWLYGEGGQTPRTAGPELDAKDRWQMSKTATDAFAPF